MSATKKSKDPQETLRRRTVQFVLDGESQSAAARKFGVTRQAVSKWMKAYRQHGPAGLATKPRGRPKRSG